MSGRVALTLAVALLGAPLRGQEPVTLPPADSTAVLVDVVVRDGKGRPITDLVAGDFEVLEDGTPQVVAQFAPPNVVAAATAVRRIRPPPSPSSRRRPHPRS